LESVHTQDKPATDPARLVYDYVGDQIAALIPRFSLESWQPQILQIYEDICRDSLAFPLGTKPTRFSRINQDGTPFQYAVTLGSPLHSLQFISEASLSGLEGIGPSGAERLRVNRECINIVARRLKADEALSGIARLLDGLAPATNVDLLADPAGAFWIGVAFTALREPQVRIYTNASWGSETDRWRRLRRFASTFGALASWQEIERRLAHDMKPLGTAITIGGKSPPTGRIYLTSFGKRTGYYEELAEATSGASFKHVLQQFVKCMLGDDYLYPTQTAVCSYGFGAGAGLDFKFELCAHCLFVSDIEAESRLRSWFSMASMDPADYVDLLDILAEGQLSRTAPELHCYMGVGLKQGSPYSTIYLKPKIVFPKARLIQTDGQ
jgi:hypothetical protein